MRGEKSSLLVEKCLTSLRNMGEVFKFYYNDDEGVFIYTSQNYKLVSYIRDGCDVSGRSIGGVYIYENKYLFINDDYYWEYYGYFENEADLFNVIKSIMLELE